MGNVLAKLQAVKEAGTTVFNRTTTLLGAGMGNASSHTCKNLPIVLAGGFKHGQHIAFDAVNNTPLCRLYVSILQRFGYQRPPVHHRPRHFARAGAGVNANAVRCSSGRISLSLTEQRIMA